MKAEWFVVSPETYEPALNVLGVSVTVLASNIQTHGYEITLQSGGEGAGPPPVATSGTNRSSFSGAL